MRNQQIRTMEELQSIKRLREILAERDRDKEFNTIFRVVTAAFIIMIAAVVWFTASCTWRF